jgi:hypothetical protein
MDGGQDEGGNDSSPGKRRSVSSDTALGSNMHNLEIRSDPGSLQTPSSLKRTGSADSSASGASPSAVSVGNATGSVTAVRRVSVGSGSSASAASSAASASSGTDSGYRLINGQMHAIAGTEKPVDGAYDPDMVSSKF